MHKVNTTYKHYKGNYYTLLYIATHSETLEKYVVYQQQYGNKEIWIRPYTMFFETIEINGIAQKRFEPLQD